MFWFLVTGAIGRLLTVPEFFDAGEAKKPLGLAQPLKFERSA
jgi:hypothetical protein